MFCHRLGIGYHCDCDDTVNDAGIFFYLGVVCFSVSLCETVDDAEFFIRSEMGTC